MTDLTVAQRRLRSDVTVHVEDTGGAGRPVVLIHGWPLSGEAWQDQVPALQEAGYRVVTYDRRGFGRSDKPNTGYDYDTLAGDLAEILEQLDLRDVTLVGFSMGGGEVARYIAAHGEERLRSVVLASAVPPMMMKTPGNPDGPLDPAEAAKMTAALTADAEGFYDGFVTDFFTAGEELQATEAQRQEALALTRQADTIAALSAMQSFGLSDFREDLTKITVPTLVIHGDSDGVVPFEGSGARSHAAVPHSELVLITGGPHGINVSHAAGFNRALLDFLSR